MKQGDFTKLAKQYHNRPAYSKFLLEKLLVCVNEAHTPLHEFQLVEVGAGTGKLTRVLSDFGIKILAIEPNDAMRNEGIEALKDTNVVWKKGSGEDTGVESKFADWVVMASSFHWTDPNKSLPEFARILKDSHSSSAVRGGGALFHCFMESKKHNRGVSIL